MSKFAEFNGVECLRRAVAAFSTFGSVPHKCVPHDDSQSVTRLLLDFF